MEVIDIQTKEMMNRKIIEGIRHEVQQPTQSINLKDTFKEVDEAKQYTGHVFRGDLKLVLIQLVATTLILH